MAQQFGSPPSGLNYDVFSGSVPNGMLYRIKSIEGLSKQTIKLVPTTGQSSVGPGNKIIVSLPMNSLLDLSTFEWYFYGQTNHAGAQSGGPTGYVRARFFSRNMQSLIETLEIKVNGKSIQNIPQYNYIFNMLHDYQCGWDANTKRRIGENGDPSNKSYYKKGRVISRRGYPVGYTAHDESQRDADNYCVRNWLGLLGNPSTQIIHTDMFGQIDIEITLTQAGVLMLGVDPGASAVTGITATAPTSTNAWGSNTGTPAFNISGFTDNTGLAQQGTGTATASATAAESASFTLSSIGFSITRYDMPSSFYGAMRDVLASGAVYKLYYDHFTPFTGQSTADKSGTTRFQITSKSLNYVIGTFQVPSRDTIDAPLNSIISTKSQLEFGNSMATVANQIASGMPLTFNQSKYFVRNGSGVKQSTWIVGNVRLTPQTVLEDYNSILKAFGTKNDVNGGMYPGCKNLGDFIQCFYGSILSLQAIGEQDMYTISGLDSSQQPVSVAWEVTGGDDITSAPDTNQNTVPYKTNDGNCIPILIACTSPHLDITVGRNVVLYS